MVGLGQTVCRAIAPKCHECKITHLCPAYIRPEDCL
jgi:endonuclease III